MRGEVARRTLAARKKSLLGWGIGVAGFMVLIVASYPAIRDQSGITDLIDEYPDWVQQILGLGGGLSITSPAGYLNSQVFANVLPLVFLIFLIAFAVREVAGAEQDGTMELTLAHPVTRDDYLLEKTLAMIGGGVLLALVAAVTMLVPALAIAMDLSIWGVISAIVSVFAMCLLFGVLALAVAAATGSKALALGISAGLGVAAYVLWGLQSLLDAIAVTRFFNPFHWALAGDPILDGIQAANIAGLLVATAVLLGLAVWLFRGRDLGV
jgi:ABC-2 type transport system permease protein